ncbi:hypothetical protein WJS89_03295 [Sphingomicrobium sp. XHP0235]|uniref:hypothetical protein n=1 Tax=Sphingomicrobium aquimarinum TaxID=3133971 RepID=UPI0031FF1A32
MRSIAAVILIVLLAGCQKEPTFDERFDETREELLSKAEELDEEIEQSEAQPGADETAAEPKESD